MIDGIWRRWALGACAAAAVGAPVGAQEPAPTPTPTPPDAERLALAHQVFQSIGGADALVTSFRGAIAASASQLPKTGTAQDQAAAADMQRFIADRLAFYTPDIVRTAEVVYAREFTAAQLRDVLAFYRSPTGQAFARKLPETSRESVLALRPVTIRLQRDVLAHLCALSTCTADQRTTLAILTKAAG